MRGPSDQVDSSMGCRLCPANHPRGSATQTIGTPPNTVADITRARIDPEEAAEWQLFWRDYILPRQGRNASIPWPPTIKEVEELVVRDSIYRHRGNLKRCAEELGTSLKTVYNKIEQHGLSEHLARSRR